MPPIHPSSLSDTHIHTQTSKIEDLARLSLKGKPTVVREGGRGEEGREWRVERGRESSRASRQW